MNNRIKLFIPALLIILLTAGITVLANEEENQEQLNIEEETSSQEQEEGKSINWISGGPGMVDTPIIEIENEPIIQAKDLAETRYTTDSLYVYNSPQDEYYFMIIGPNNKIKVGLSEVDGWYKIYIGKGCYYVKSENIKDEQGYKDFCECPVYNEAVLLTEEEQKHLYELCNQYGIKYAFALATMELESGEHDENDNLIEFNRQATHHNSNGSTDRGICQVNSCWIKKLTNLGIISCSDDLYNSLIGMDAGMWVLSDAVNQFGNTEKAYAYYNTGNSKVNSNINSRKVMKYWERYKAILGDV